jgi:hypothetical protein
MLQHVIRHIGVEEVELVICHVNAALLRVLVRDLYHLDPVVGRLEELLPPSEEVLISVIACQKPHLSPLWNRRIDHYALLA